MKNTCVFGNPLSDEALFAFLTKEADETIITHVTRCPFCMARAKRFSIMQDLLKQTLFRRNCPEPLQLSEYYLHLLPNAEMTAIRHHIAECPHCAAELADFATFAKSTSIPVSSAIPMKQHLEIFWKTFGTHQIVGRFFSGATTSSMQFASIPVKGHSSVANELYRFSITPDKNTDIDAEITILPQDNPILVTIRVQATIPSVWPSVAALQVTLISNNWIRSETTGDNEQVTFPNILQDELPSISFEITPVEP